ncbi:hypothetical protein PDIDSM_2295 [Penicillium digitatum]|nr:hypothetical protein PDIDSM_2295 [Penicillium digitatum]
MPPSPSRNWPPASEALRHTSARAERDRLSNNPHTLFAAYPADPLQSNSPASSETKATKPSAIAQARFQTPCSPHTSSSRATIGRPEDQKARPSLESVTSNAHFRHNPTKPTAGEDDITTCVNSLGNKRLNQLAWVETDWPCHCSRRPKGQMLIWTPPRQYVSSKRSFGSLSADLELHTTGSQTPVPHSPGRATPTLEADEDPPVLDMPPTASPCACRHKLDA